MFAASGRISTLVISFWPLHARFLLASWLLNYTAIGGKMQMRPPVASFWMVGVFNCEIWALQSQEISHFLPCRQPTTGLPNEEDAAEWLHQEPWKKCEAGRCTSVSFSARQPAVHEKQVTSVPWLGSQSCFLSPSDTQSMRGKRVVKGQNLAPVDIVSRHAAMHSNTQYYHKILYDIVLPYWTHNFHGVGGAWLCLSSVTTWQFPCVFVFSPARP